jgi:site-specific DNA-methyltransferase (adenine-specific)
MGGFELFRGDALDAYRSWPTPATIISDGAYGVRGFHGDTAGSGALPAWYRRHIKSWTAAAGPATTLWFWNTEIGWASVHPVLAEYGWDYVQLIVWDKGLAHIAGNVNGRTIRQFPVVTEVCAFYQRAFTVTGPDGPMPVKQWVRHEWARSGLPLNRANDACGVKNAATRKYLTRDWLWYWPPGEMTERLAGYANAHGRPSGWPYYSLDGQRPVTAKEWDALRYRWRHVHGLTNVWSRRPLHDEERLKGTLRRAAPRVYNPTAASSAHLNQKPLEFMERLIAAVTEPGEVVWEPFGGLCSASVAAVTLGRRAFAAETDPTFADLAAERLGRLPPAHVIGESGRVDRQQWDERYSGAEFEWSVHPNQFVAAELAGLPPGRAAGEGRNSVWLAERGWSVTAVDFSRVGLDKGRRLSAARGVDGGQVDWVVADLSDYEPARDAFELVLIAYLQVDAVLRARVLAGAAAALAPGGTLLVVGHDLTNLTEGTGGPQSPDVLYTPEAIAADLPGLRILRADRVRRSVERDGGTATAIDTLVRAERQPLSTPAEPGP